MFHKQILSIVISTIIQNPIAAASVASIKQYSSDSNHFVVTEMVPLTIYDTAYAP
jgi:hypothetical protein